MLGWFFGVILIAIMSVAGWLKVTGNPIAVETANRLGYRPIMAVIGALELASALGIAVGLVTSGAGDWIGLLAGFGIIAVMVGAFAYHQRVADDLRQMVPAIAVLVLAALYLFST